MTDRRDPGEEYGEDASDELMARAEALPGSFTVEIRDGELVFTEVDASGRARRAVRSDGDDGPLVWRPLRAVVRDGQIVYLEGDEETPERE